MGKGKEEKKAFCLSGGFSPSSHFLQQTPKTSPSKCRQSLQGLSQTFIHLIYANTEQNELNIANYINNLFSVAKNSQEYLNNPKVFTCKFHKFGQGMLWGGFCLFHCFWFWVFFVPEGTSLSFAVISS